MSAGAARSDDDGNAAANAGLLDVEPARTDPDARSVVDTAAVLELLQAVERDLTRLSAEADRIIDQDLVKEPQAPRVTYVIPCRNESDNIRPLVTRLLVAAGSLLDGPDKSPAALSAVLEILFVDDSDDDTPDVVRALRVEGLPVDVLHRPAGQRGGGMSGALATGFAAARGAVICVMDSDLQHPPELTPELIAPIMRGDADMAIASRYIPGGSAAGLGGRWRLAASVGSRSIIHVFLPSTRKLTDPGGNFFAFQRSLLDGVVLKPQGFKMLMEILAKTNWSRPVELPYVFDNRNAGTTSFSMREVWRFFQHLGRLSTPSARRGRRQGKRQRRLAG